MSDVRRVDSSGLLNSYEVGLGLERDLGVQIKAVEVVIHRKERGLAVNEILTE